ncbi:MAG: DUF2218 domain-containing protein [Rhodospirillaceae bacterium]|nr:DUF2218 domain-containing protein [Rhodospirillaceae bacterium]
MIASQGNVPTAHASRYLQQLCKHWSHKFAVEFTPEKGRIVFADDRVASFEAKPDTLVLRVEVADAAMLARMQTVVVDHLKRFAFREDLGEIRWHDA